MTVADDGVTIRAIMVGDVQATTRFWRDADDDEEGDNYTRDNRCAACGREITDDAKRCRACENGRRAAARSQVKRFLAMASRGEVDAVAWPRRAAEPPKGRRAREPLREGQT